MNPHEVLLNVYAIERQDDTDSVSIYAVLLSAWLALVGVIGYVLLREVEQPAWLLALLPIAPLPLAGLGALLLAAGSARACLIHALEAELQRLGVQADGAPVPSFHTISRSATSRGFSLPVFRFALYLPLIGLYFAVSSWSLWLAWEKNPPLAVLGAAVVAVPVYHIGRLAARSLAHRELWAREAGVLVSSLKAAPPRRSAAGTASSEPPAAR